MASKRAKPQSRTPATPRPSASVLIIVPKENPIPGDADYDILMLKRNAKGSFVNGLVFPGGNVDKIDSSPKWRELIGDHAEQYRHSNTSLPSLEHAICAVRETFEECGLLITDPPIALKDEQRLPLRKKVHDDASHFLEYLSTRSPPACGHLIPFSRWITPANSAKRFDTFFFITFLSCSTSAKSAQGGVLPHHETTPTADNTETTQLVRKSPQQILKDFEDQDSLPEDAEKVSLYPPQWYSLHTLEPYMSWKALRADMLKDWQGMMNGTQELLTQAPELSKKASMEGLDIPALKRTKLPPGEPNPDDQTNIIPTATIVYKGDELHSSSKGKSEMEGKLHRLQFSLKEGVMTDFHLIKGDKKQKARI